MSAFSDFYSLLKDFVALAKKAKNQELVNMALDLQEKYFDLREDNDNLVEKIKSLNERISSLEDSKVLEENIVYYKRGFFTLNTDKKKLPYCSMCWKKEHRLIPIAQSKSWYQYKCGNCKNEIIVMDDLGQPLK